MSEPLLRIEKLSYRYPDGPGQALRDVSLEVQAGELIVLAGRSGSGKSTLLRAACGLVPHYHGGDVAGQINVAGLDVRDHGPADLGGVVGLVAQEPEAQVVSATVRGELELPLEMRGEPPGVRGRAVEEAALAMGIGHLLGRTPASLSGGELQRVALATALVLRPRMVLLDEPTSQLDPVAGDELIWLLRRLNEEWGMAVVLAEHRLERCLGAADRVVAMSAGRIAFDGKPGRFLEWAVAHDEALATPAARLFSLAGLRPLPTAVKQARELLGAQRLVPDVSLDGAGVGASAAPARSKPRPPLALRARGLWAALGHGERSREVLHGIDLEVRAGERVALMGRNGAGKSTLLRAAAGLIAPSRGRIEAPSDCALCSQSPADFLLFDRVASELPGPAGAAALELVGLEWARERDPRDLSGGERQRLALAVVMAGRSDGAAPGLVCLDEPTRGMDRAGKAELTAWLRELSAAGAAVIVATHEVELAASFAERVLLLGDGELVADGPPAAILAGGWYFATEVARVLGGSGPISPEQGAALLRDRLAGAAGRESGS